MNTETDLEHTMELAAISCASNANTPDSKEERLKKGDRYYTTTYADVCAAVDREMEWRGKFYAEAQRCRQLEQLLETAKNHAQDLARRLRDFTNVIAWQPPEKRKCVQVTLMADLAVLDAMKIPKEKVYAEFLRVGAQKLYDFATNPS